MTLPSTDLGSPPLSFADSIRALATHADPESGCVRCCAALRRGDCEAFCSTGHVIAARGQDALSGEPRRDLVYAILTIERHDELCNVVVVGREHEGSPELLGDDASRGTPRVKPGVEYVEARWTSGAVCELTKDEQESAVRVLEESGR